MYLFDEVLNNLMYLCTGLLELFGLTQKGLNVLIFFLRNLKQHATLHSEMFGIKRDFWAKIGSYYRNRCLICLVSLSLLSVCLFENMSGSHISLVAMRIHVL